MKLVGGRHCIAERVWVSVGDKSSSLRFLRSSRNRDIRMGIRLIGLDLAKASRD